MYEIEYMIYVNLILMLMRSGYHKKTDALKHRLQKLGFY